jgi:hypothetical protein
MLTTDCPVTVRPVTVYIRRLMLSYVSSLDCDSPLSRFVFNRQLKCGHPYSLDACNKLGSQHHCIVQLVVDRIVQIVVRLIVQIVIRLLARREPLSGV